MRPRCKVSQQKTVERDLCVLKPRRVFVSHKTVFKYRRHCLWKSCAHRSCPRARRRGIWVDGGTAPCTLISGLGRSGQVHAFSTLLPESWTTLATEHASLWKPQLVWTTWRRENLCRESKHVFSVVHAHICASENGHGKLQRTGYKNHAP
jgi:hypothetical protein